MNCALRGYLLLTTIICSIAARAQFIPPLPPIPAAKELSRIAVPAVQNMSPRYSPDGKWVAFLRGSSHDEAKELWVMHADGTRPAKLVSLDEVARKSLQEYRRVYDGFGQDIRSLRTIRYLEWLSTSDALICGAATANGRPEIIFTVSQQGHLTLIANPLMSCRSGIAGFGNNPPLLIAPDRKCLAIIGAGAFFTMDIANPLKGNDEFSGAFVPTGYMHLEGEDIVKVEATGDGCWGSDGLWYFADTEGNLCSLSQQGKLLFLVRSNEDKAIPQIYAAPALSKDGKWLAYLRDGKLVQREVATGKERSLAEDVAVFRWLADGRLLVITQHNAKGPGGQSAIVASNIHLFYDGVEKNSTRIKGTIQSDVSPNGQHMVFEQEGSLYLMDMAKNNLE